MEDAVAETRRAEARAEAAEAALADAEEQTARAERRADAAERTVAERTNGAVTGNDAAAARKLAAAESAAARLRATVEALERDNKSLQWQVAMVGGTDGATARGSKPAETVVDVGVAAGGTGAGTVARVLRKRNRRYAATAYLAALHVVVFLSVMRGGGAGRAS